MGCAPEPNYHGRQLIRGLKKMRELAFLTQEEAGAKLNITLQKLSRFENGQLPGWHELRAMLDLYCLPSDEWDFYLELWELAKKPGWWRKFGLKDPRYVRMEDEASTAYEFQLGYLPELTQTEQYARTTIVGCSRKYTENQVAVRMRRQDRLWADPPLRLHTIVHEPVLYQGVDRTQLVRLTQLAQLPNVTFQVLPQTSLHPGLRSAMMLLTFEDPYEPDIVFTETVLGWTDSQDAGQTGTVRRMLDQLSALALSPEESLRLLVTGPGRCATPAAPARSGSS
jgi:hypothetical protein